MWLFLSAPKREKPLSISQMQQEQKASTTSKSFFLGGGEGRQFFSLLLDKTRFQSFLFDLRCCPSDSNCDKTGRIILFARKVRERERDREKRS